MATSGWKGWAYIAAGSVLLLAGAFIPAHLRWVNASVLRVAGARTAGVADHAQRAVAEERVGPAGVLLEVTAAVEPAAAAVGRDRLNAVLQEKPGLARWGAANEWLDRQLGAVVGENATPRRAVLGWILPAETRAALLRAVTGSSDQRVAAMLACRKLERTTVLAPVGSAAGQPMDAAILLASTLLERQRVHPGLAGDLAESARAATMKGESAALEAILLDLLVAARHFDWESLATLTERCEKAEALRALATAAGGDGERWAWVYAGVVMDGGSQRLGRLLSAQGDGGFADFKAAVPLGEGAVQELLRQGLRVYSGGWQKWVLEAVGAGEASRWLAAATLGARWFAFAVRQLLWIDGLLLLATGIWYAYRAWMGDTGRWWHAPRPDGRLVAVTAGTVAVFLLLASEGFLALKSATPGKPGTPGATSMLPVVRARLRMDPPSVTKGLMNDKIIGMLAAFFVIQLAIYLIGLNRVRQIRRRDSEESVKLRLLDNEEPLFDAPLYVGIAGSVLALVLRLTGFEAVSLMASYSSTLFGILFCFVLKVLHVRPYRQQLILDSAERTLP